MRDSPSSSKVPAKFGVWKRIALLVLAFAALGVLGSALLFSGSEVECIEGAAERGLELRRDFDVARSEASCPSLTERPPRPPFAARLDPCEVDLLISASFPALPETCIGNATQVAYDLGMEKSAVYNMESACAGGLLAIRTACQEVRRRSTWTRVPWPWREGT